MHEHSESGATRESWPALVVHAVVDPAIVSTLRLELPTLLERRLRRMHSVEAQARTLTGYWLLLQACRLRGLSHPPLSAIEISAAGRPAWPDGPAFNISHSQHRAACIVAPDGLLGLDVEKRRPLRLTRFKRFLTHAEWRRCEEDPEAFFEAWTTREAVVKATGRVGLSRIARVVPAPGGADLGGQWLHLRHFELDGGYTLCVASNRVLPGLQVQSLDASATPRK